MHAKIATRINFSYNTSVSYSVTRKIAVHGRIMTRHSHCEGLSKAVVLYPCDKVNFNTHFLRKFVWLS
jgi:hypothetical protein